MFQKPRRAIYAVYIHCSASDNPAHDSVDVIRQWHLEKGWSDIGYHYFIRKDGTLEEGRSLERIPAAQRGFNTGSIAVCLHGLEEDNFTEEQFTTLKSLCKKIKEVYRDITFHGHREVNPHKTCPVFDYKKVLNLTEQGKMREC